jgi:glycosyltransferase involved in cell wall biosynthesis
MEKSRTSRDRVCLVVPCYNEATRLKSDAFHEALDAFHWLDVLFVNDGSTDRTAEVLDALATQRPERISVLHCAANGGKAVAVREGMRQGLGRAAIIGFCDADLSAPLAEVAMLRDVLLERAQVQWVWGIRLLSLGRIIERRASRHYLGRIFATVTSVTLGIRAYDTQCGCKLFRASSLLEAVLQQPFRSRWIFDVELLARADAWLRRTNGGTVETLVYEQPLREWRHQAGSKVRPGDFVRAIGELLVIRREARR